MTRFGFLTSWLAAVLALAAFLAVGGMTGTAVAQTAKDSPKPPSAANEKSEKKEPATTAAGVPEGQASSSAAATAGLKVVKDPKTGKLRGPDRAEAAKMNGPAMNRSIEGLQAVRLPGGVTVVDLQGRFQSYTVATKKPDGGIEIECHSTEPGHAHAPDENGDAKTGAADHDAGNAPSVNVHGK